MMNYLLVLLWLPALVPPAAHAAEGSLSPVGDVRLAPGLVARYEYHFDRNAFLASERAGDALIALTRSGNVLRFDAKTLKPTGEWFGPVRASCLVHGGGDAVLVGFDDGRVCRLDPETFALVEVAKLPNRVQWIGSSKAADGRGGLVAVIEQWNGFPRVGSHAEEMPSVVHDLASGKTFSLTGPGPRDGEVRKATAFLLDRKRRLWLGGFDQRAGWCVRLDLESGRVAEVEGINEPPLVLGPGRIGVCGFVEWPDGRVWAFGGSSGFSGRGSLCRVDGPKVEVLYRTGDGDARAPRPGRPASPIDRVLTDREGRLLVFSSSEIYRVDAGLRAWSRGPELRVSGRPGGPVPLLDLFHHESPIVAVHGPDAPGDRLALATILDGYVSVANGRQSAHALPGQFGLDDVRQASGSTEGTLFLGWGGSPPWRLGADGWSAVRLEGPHPPGPNYLGDSTLAHPLVTPDGTLYTASDPQAASQTLARWRAGKAEVLARDGPSLIETSLFATPDRVLWSLGLDRKLGRLVDGRWAHVAELPLGSTGLRALNKPGDPFGHGEIFRPPALRPLPGTGSPWILLESNEHQLLRFAYEPGFKAPRLETIKVEEGGKALRVLDAVAWGDGELLLATDKGLRRLHIASSQVRSHGLPAPGRPVTSLARDGLGRTWLAGEGLWLVDADGTRLHDCGALPMLGRTPVAALAADPGHRDGVIACLGPRGAVFVRVPPGS